METTEEKKGMMPGERVAKEPKVYRFKVFGWHVAIANRGFQVKLLCKKRSKRRNWAKHERLEIAGFRCEICVIPVDMRCAVHHRLPKGEPERNAVENILVTCTDCHLRLQAEPHPLAIRQLEDETRYDPDRIEHKDYGPAYGSYYDKEKGGVYIDESGIEEIEKI